jgi:hypothetical protein
VSNLDRDGGRLLDAITLRVEKSRYGLSGRIDYHYAGGKMLRDEEPAPSKPVSEQLLEELKANPGILTEPFAELAHKAFPLPPCARAAKRHIQGRRVYRP